MRNPEYLTKGEILQSLVVGRIPETSHSTSCVVLVVLNGSTGSIDTVHLAAGPDETENDVRAYAMLHPVAGVPRIDGRRQIVSCPARPICKPRLMAATAGCIVCGGAATHNYGGRGLVCGDCCPGCGKGGEAQRNAEAAFLAEVAKRERARAACSTGVMPHVYAGNSVCVSCGRDAGNPAQD